VLDSVRRDGGAMVAVSEDALDDAVGMLARRAGVGAEPAGASAVAGLETAVEQGLVDPSETVVVLATGRGKATTAPVDPRRVAVVDSLDAVERALADDH
jgi:threonine synthase